MPHIAEEVERAALEELHSVAPTAVRQSIGLAGQTIGSAFVSVARALPPTAIVLNRTIGVGLRKPETRKTINEIVDAYQAAGVTRYFVQVHPDAEPEEIGTWLLERGIEKARGWQKFSRSRKAVAPPSTDFTIKEIGKKSSADFAAILTNAFDLGDAARPWLSLLPTCRHWHVFITYDGEVPAGTGAVFLDGKYAWLDFGATAPAFRRRDGPRSSRPTQGESRGSDRRSYGWAHRAG